jgi:multidrug resistance protein MdtO
MGSAIGGLILGLGATAFIFPNIDSLTPFVLVIVVVTFIAAWGATGPKLGYVGLQIAFAFYLVALEGFSAPTELAPARDRFIGIMLALVIMSFVFDQMWPVRTVTAMRRALASVLHREAELFRLVVKSTNQQDMLEHADTLRDHVGKTVQGLRTMNDTVDYEYGVDRELHKRVSQTILKAGLTAVALFWNQLAVFHRVTDRDFVTQPDLMDMLRKLADHLDAMADAVAETKLPDIVPATSLATPSLLTDPRYGEYTRNTIARYDELQAAISSMGVEI